MTTNLFDKVYSKLKDEAFKSPLNHQHCAAILKNKKIIGNPCSNHYGDIRSESTLGSMHAETNAIISFFGKDLHYEHKSEKWKISPLRKRVNNKFDIIVLRINNNGDTMNSRPCFRCLKMMQNVGIKNIFYSSNNSNELICERVNDMISIQFSAVTMNICCAKYDDINMNRKNYLEKILKSYFPKYVKKKNLHHFMNHGFSKMFSNYIIIVDCNVVEIKDTIGKIIVRSHII